MLIRFVFTFFLVFDCYSTVFNSINKKQIVLSDQIIKSIESSLSGKNVKNQENLSISNSHVNGFREPNLIKNYCVKFKFLGNEKNLVRIYSNSKIFIPQLKKKNELQLSLRNSTNIIQVSFGANQMISTNIFLGNFQGVESGCLDYEIPFLAKEFFPNEEIFGSGILIKMSNYLESVNVDDQHKEKLLLDKDFKSVGININKAEYVLFKSLTPGNTVIKFGIKDIGLVTEMIHLIDGEITYIGDRFIQSNNLSLSFFNENLMSKELEPVLVTKKIYNAISNEVLSKFKNGENQLRSFRLKHSKLLVHNNLKLLDKNLYYNVGSNDQGISIPSKEYVELFYQRNNLYEDNEFCIVQISPKGKVLAIDVSNSDGFKIESPDLISKDIFGKMSSVPSVNTDTLYIIGYLKGVIDYRIVYKDSANQYGQVPCSDESYIIEQLL
tara:strand:+ start:1121 stop:2437 length:1317 start_codon:yes stop_codon:yes gene_type:complete